MKPLLPPELFGSCSDRGEQAEGGFWGREAALSDPQLLGFTPVAELRMESPGALEGRGDTHKEMLRARRRSSWL